mmetsp:Transcript_8429/g.25298  ORF Transcript_8429/g.25298 Transcript_8429/m.25298 type:complete len:250 (-) Transcript_8429:1273-2022(-)|eukprot:CAMPEP_0206136346 /NCGR_PEP_ID=MMETSP1473-20131121/1574_1 /ASSEMBLY_ACC=CAM_ASM_001109 /TAXON_ID=1461547 /ORGANISM="Stichococcus sp, Strain RCC1054" /LENGTH=249 /DNA_ID=CAMNT_0053528805 /DNA_START=67 /DNA_END=816 /DNA_ORIENTATION=+
MAEGAQPDARKAQSAFVRAASTSAGERKTVGERTKELSSIGFDGQPIGGGGCPVVGVEASSSGQPLPEGHPALPTERQVSSIPYGAADTPAHQPQAAEAGAWVYPSEAQFYGAMKRKGWPADPKDMQSIVAIHNGVNERAWHQILRYEALHDGCTPKLKRFMGRPADYSPKARFLNLLGYKLPFDRHDWIIDRCGHEVRYVIDFYNAAPAEGMPVSMFLDARPALDSPSALWDRLRLHWGFVQSTDPVR